MKSCEDGAQAHRFFPGRSSGQFSFWRVRQRLDAQGEDGREDRDRDGDGIDGVRAAEQGVGDASDGGAGDGSDLKGAGVPGDRVQEMLFGN